ncbi:ABC transporter permease [Aliiglaciecola sp. CAU 1673]|uniref:ABC transporter permease n=1 Tax=Aliiglaciecola sp. CAU 1673 TaxID=3032595 RepID=UPI0023DAE124|nr:ABC transporter permease [Aliiglaciecola sp. CAU 1673]MDF2179586.1 ABC transporter permease [Aliiglaciecola sp. CAU 1673]
MLVYLGRRLNLLVITLFILCAGSFALAFLFPGDPLTNLSGLANPDEQLRQQLMHKYALDQGFFASLWQYFQLIFAGDWGISMRSGSSVFEEVTRTLPASIELSVYAMVLSLFIGLPLGIFSGLSHRKALDRGILSFSLIGYSVPVFWLALLMILVFALKLGVLPMSDRVSLLYDVPLNTGFVLLDILQSDMEHREAALQNAFAHLILPTLSLTVFTCSLIVRLTRRSVINVMDSDYIKAAYAKGMSRSEVVWQHGLKNALIPIMPQLVMQFTLLMTNAMIVEVIFSWPGIGEWMIQAIYQRDFPSIRGGMLAVSVVVVSFTISMDVLLKLLYPLSKRQLHAQV